MTAPVCPDCNEPVSQSLYPGDTRHPRCERIEAAETAPEPRRRTVLIRRVDGAWVVTVRRQGRGDVEATFYRSKRPTKAEVQQVCNYPQETP